MTHYLQPMQGNKNNNYYDGDLFGDNLYASLSHGKRVLDLSTFIFKFFKGRKHDSS